MYAQEFIKIWGSKKWPKQAAFIALGRRNNMFREELIRQRSWAWGTELVK